VKNGLPLCLIGDSGTGKSHLLIALGTEAEMAGYRVKYMNSSKPPTTKSSPRPSPATAASICCASMKLGYLVLDQRGAELMFQVLTEREEKNSVAIASNESFGGWTKTFTDPRLCAAIVDRLTFGGNIIETGTDSYRLARTDSATST
jgi:DNA replication protein DnaC